MSDIIELPVKELQSLSKGDLTEATSSVLTIVGGTDAVIGSGVTIEVAEANTTTSGYITDTDWNTFNGKQDALTSGDVTANLLQNAAADLGAADVEINFTNSNGAFVVNHNIDGVYKVAGTQVVGAQVAALGLDAETDANKITAIIAALRSHGLLGPNA